MTVIIRESAIILPKKKKIIAPGERSRIGKTAFSISCAFEFVISLARRRRRRKMPLSWQSSSSHSLRQNPWIKPKKLGSSHELKAPFEADKASFHPVLALPSLSPFNRTIRMKVTWRAVESSSSSAASDPTKGFFSGVTFQTIFYILSFSFFAFYHPK